MKTPIGVGVVCAFEVLFGIETGLMGLMYFVFGFYGGLHEAWWRLLGSLGIASLLLIVSAGCFYTCSAVSRGGERWAWKASLGIGLLAALPGAFFIYGATKPWPNASGEEGWGFVIGLIVLVPVLCGWIALLLPSTRRFFALGRSSQPLL
jgi:hypothetical protein